MYPRKTSHHGWTGPIVYFFDNNHRGMATDLEILCGAHPGRTVPSHHVRGKALPTMVAGLDHALGHGAVVRRRLLFAPSGTQPKNGPGSHVLTTHPCGPRTTGVEPVVEGTRHGPCPAPHVWTGLVGWPTLKAAFETGTLRPLATSYCDMFQMSQSSATGSQDARGIAAGGRDAGRLEGPTIQIGLGDDHCHPLEHHQLVVETIGSSTGRQYACQ